MKSVENLQTIRGLFRSKAVPFFDSMKLFLQRLPWKLVLTVAGFVLFLAMILFHFFLATPEKVIKELSRNYEQYTELNEKIGSASNAIDKMTKEKLDSVQQELHDLRDTLEQTKITKLPSKIVADYAFRGADDTIKQYINDLYSAENQPELVIITENADVFAEVAGIEKELFERSEAPEDIATLIVLLEKSVARLSELDESEYVHLDSTLKLVSYLYESAVLYRDTGDEINFDIRQSNMKSELLKEFQTAWYRGVSEQGKKINTQQQSLEALSSLDTE